MGRFHRHSDGTVHEHHGDGHEHDHRAVGDHTGYTETGRTRVEVLESILDENDRVAAETAPSCGPTASEPST